MGAAMMPAGKGGAERGFTIIEVMIAIVILSIGILTVVAGFATALSSTQNAQENLIARQKALEALESIFTARNTQQITFSEIANLGSGGIFASGAQPLWSAGNDGLVNTADDLPFAAQGVCPAGPECITLPGEDGILGTADDYPMSLANFTRQIQINPVLQADGSVNPNLKQVIVTVSYTTATPVPRSYSVTALISAYR
jgi:prepilin-type N-terminal cleavage/methylation domain-containing protein